MDNIKQAEYWLNQSDEPKQKEQLNENSTDDANKTLDAIIGFLKKQDNPSDSGKEMLTMANGIKDFYNKEKSFAPKQAEWISSTSQALFK